MELKKTTIKGREIYVMFTGDKYFFYSNYYGTLAIAERKEKKTGEPATEEEFTLTVGNHHTTGGQMADSIVISAVKRYINREENQFITKRIKYNVQYSDLAKGCLTANYLPR